MGGALSEQLFMKRSLMHVNAACQTSPVVVASLARVNDNKQGVKREKRARSLGR